jgi:nucleoside-diphosphate-sugar epimerase
MYGAGQRRTMLIPRLIDSVRNASPISLQGEDGIRINPIHVSDAFIAVKALLKQSGSYTINIAGPSILSLKQIAEMIGDELKIKPTFNYSKGEPTHLIGDISVMKELLHEPKILFRNSIKDLV